MAIEKELGIYVHIPFCISKCIYCDFLSMPMGEDAKIKYTDELCREINEFARANRDYRVKSVFFGGGTPSILSEALFEKIMTAITSQFTMEKDCEITVECNPATADMNKFRVYRECGVNRLSFGLQSVNDSELKALGRIHTYNDFLKSYKDAERSGFTNINVDIMSALPNQTAASWRHTLECATALKTAHISAYSLIVEENTPLYSMVESKKVRLPDEDTDREIYSITNEYLSKEGYTHYEISNYAKSGFECRHNIIYWQRGNYEGFGLGASSFMEGRRYSNTTDFEDYLSGGWRTKRDIENISASDAMSEFMYLGMRMMKGVSKSEFEKNFGVRMESVYGKIINKYRDTGFIICEGDFVRLSDMGIDVSNVIFADFL